MSEGTDLARDRKLAEALVRLPARPVPDGLVDRIVRNAAQLPQQSAAVGVPLETSGPQAGRVRIPGWLRYASGAAIAAGIAAALLSFGSGPSETTPAAQRSPQVAQSAPAPELASAAVQPAAPLPATAQVREQKPRTRPAANSAAPSRDNSSDQQLAQKSPSPAPTGSAPQADPAPGANGGQGLGPTQREFAGPPDTSPVGPPSPQGGAPTGMGISGSRLPELPGGPTTTAPAPRGSGPGGMPRF